MDIIFAGGKFRAKSNFANIAKINSTRKIGVIQYRQLRQAAPLCRYPLFRYCITRQCRNRSRRRCVSRSTRSPLQTKPSNRLLSCVTTFCPESVDCGKCEIIDNTSKIPVRWPGQCYGVTLSLIFKYCGGIGLY